MKSESINLSNTEITIEPINKNSLKLIFSSFKGEFNDKIRVLINKQDVEILISKLEPYCTKPIKKEDKAYDEEISIYKNGVERCLDLHQAWSYKISLDCYTDKPFDDNWITLTPTKLSYFVGLLYGYLNKMSKECLY